MIAGGCSRRPNQPDPTIVSVKLVDASGQDISGLAMCCSGVRDDVALRQAITDQDGSVTFGYGRDKLGFDLLLIPNMYYSIGSPDRPEAARHQFLMNTYGIPSPIRVHVPPNTTSMTHRVTVSAGVRLRGSLVVPGDPSQWVLARDQTGMISPVKSDGTFEVVGIPRSQPTRISLQRDYGTQRFVLDRTAAQCEHDSDIGPLILTPAYGHASIRISLQDQSGVPCVPPGLATAVVLISSDGENIYEYLPERDDVVRVDGLTDAISAPVAGTYYVSPGSVHVGGYEKLRGLIRAGRQAELDAAGIPKIVVPAEGQVSCDVNCRTTWDALCTLDPD